MQFLVYFLFVINGNLQIIDGAGSTRSTLSLLFTLFCKLMYCNRNPCFGPRRYVGTRRNLRIRFYVLVGRVQTLSVPARRHGALK